MRAEIQRGSGGAERRRDERHAAHHEGAVAPEGLDSVSAIVTDLSPSGCRVVSEEPLAADSVIWLRIGVHDPLMARVVWYDGEAAGCEFAGKLHPAVVARLLEG